MRGNSSNLIQNTQRTPNERRNNAQKAGLASGKSRQEKRHIQDALQKALSGKYEVGNAEKGETKVVGGYEALAISMIQQAILGNVQAFKEIRDTIGEKPKEMLELESNDITGIKIKFVDKSQFKHNKEQDPKIIGDYTPPLNINE